MCLFKSPRVTYFSSEMVGAGHPDATMDMIAESIVDYCIDNAKNPRVAVDGLFKNTTINLAGEITSNIKIPFRKICQDVLKDIGYTPRKSPLIN